MRSLEVEDLLLEDKDDLIISRRVVLALLFLIGYQFIPVLFIVFIAVFTLGEVDLENGLVTNFATAFSVLLLLVIFSLYFKRQIKPLLKGFIKFSNYLMAIGYFVILITLTVIYNLLIANGENSANEDGVQDMISTSPIILTIFTIAIVVPILEEIIFRYILFKPLARFSLLTAFLTSVISFAAVHMIASLSTGSFIADLPTYGSYFIASYLLTDIYYRTGNISSSILLHIFNNLFAVILSLY